MVTLSVRSKITLQDLNLNKHLHIQPEVDDIFSQTDKQLVNPSLAVLVFTQVLHFFKMHVPKALRNTEIKCFKKLKSQAQEYVETQVTGKNPA